MVCFNVQIWGGKKEIVMMWIWNVIQRFVLEVVFLVGDNDYGCLDYQSRDFFRRLIY